MESAFSAGRRPRPVAEALIAPLRDQTDAIARAWMVELVAATDLAALGELPLGALARFAPRVCGRLVGALASDDELALLEHRSGQPGDHLAAMAGPQTSVAALDALGRVVWNAALRGWGADPDARDVIALAERLALVLAVARRRLLRDGAAADRPAAPGAPGAPVAPDLAPPATRPPEPLIPPAARPPEPVSPPPPRPFEPVTPPAATSPEPEPEPEPAPLATEPPEAVPIDEILQAEIDHARHHAEPLALLLVELDDARRLDQLGLGAGSLLQTLSGAIRPLLGDHHQLIPAGPGRVWVTARAANRAHARNFGERLTGAIERAAPWHGVPLSATVGIAMLGEDGSTPAALVATADLNRFAAAARDGGAAR